jgi:hypothetical protein
LTVSAPNFGGGEPPRQHRPPCALHAASADIEMQWRPLLAAAPSYVKR